MTDKMKSFVKGILLGLCGHPLPQGKEPETFLYAHMARDGETPTHTIDGVGYVGAVTPDIDTVWTDKKAYPYCIVATNEYGTNVMFYTTPAYIVGVKAKVNEGCIHVTYTLIDGVWSFEGESSVLVDGDVLSRDISSWCWTSHDLCYEDGSICLAATVPTPVNE